jgi:hypothetical protein
MPASVQLHSLTLLYIKISFNTQEGYLLTAVYVDGIISPHGIPAKKFLWGYVTSGRQNIKTNGEYGRDVDYLAHKSQQQLHWHREGKLRASILYAGSIGGSPTADRRNRLAAHPQQGGSVLEQFPHQNHISDTLNLLKEDELLGEPALL